MDIMNGKKQFVHYAALHAHSVRMRPIATDVERVVVCVSVFVY